MNCSSRQKNCFPGFSPKIVAGILHCQINANGPARCGLTNPQHRRKSGLDMAIQAEQGVTCHNLLDRAIRRMP